MADFTYTAQLNGNRAWETKNLYEKLVRAIESIPDSKSLQMDIVYKDLPAVPTEYRFGKENADYSSLRIFENSSQPKNVRFNFNGTEENNLRAKKAILENIEGLELF